MNTKPLRIGNAQAFWGDSPDAVRNLLQGQPDLDFLTLDYLSELSMSILSIQREKQPDCGFAKDFVESLRLLIPFWLEGSKVRVITNAGGLNPLGCAEICQLVLQAAGLTQIKIGIVYGDDILAELIAHHDDQNFKNLDSGAPLSKVLKKLVTANAYLGAAPIAELIKGGADLIITGRVADPSLTVAPCLAHYGWDKQDYDKIAQATVAGHLIECGTQVTGGISSNWLALEDKVDIGFPIVEIESDGSFVITKPVGSGGKVSMETVKEQLLYEIGDPSAYLSPDALVSFLNIQLEEVGKNRIRVSGACGSAPPSVFKVSATYRDGWKADAMLTFFGLKAYEKAKLSGEIIFQRLQNKGIIPERKLIECIGTEGCQNAVECVLHVAAADQLREPLEAFSKEIAPLVTSGAAGTSGYTSGRPHLRQVFGFWPCLIECNRVHPLVKMLTPELQ